MGSTSLVAVKDKSSEPQLEGDIRTTVWTEASARKAAEGEDVQMSPGDLTARLREISRVSIAEIDDLIIELQTLRRTLSAQATQLTNIVLDGVKQLPTRA
jgi:hypothetical protein